MALRERSPGTLDPKILSKELSAVLNAAGARLIDLNRQVLTPEALLLTFVESEEANAHSLLKDLLKARGYQWQRFAGEVDGLAHERVAPDVDFDWVDDGNHRIPLSVELLIVFDEALTLARARDEVYVGSEHALAGMTHRRVSAARLLERHGITERAVQEALAGRSAARSATTTDFVALA